MTSLQSTSSVASGLGGVRQRFDSEYLAKQLPVFQERAPRVGQVKTQLTLCVCVLSCMCQCMLNKQLLRSNWQSSAHHVHIHLQV